MLSKIIDISIFSILFFSSMILFREPVEFYVTYIPLILLLVLFIFKFKFPTRLFYLLLPLLFFGLFNIFFNNNTFPDFFKIYLNVFMSVLFFYYVFEYYNRDIVKFFSMYMNWCVVVAAIGIFQLISYWLHFEYGYDYRILFGLNKWGVNPGGLGIRVNSILCEPSYIGSTLGPAFFISLYNLAFKANYFISKRACLIIIATYLLSASSVSYLGIFIVLILLLINYGVIRYILFVIPLAMILFYFAYNNIKEFKVRVDGVTTLYFTDILEKEGIQKDSKGGFGYINSQKNYLLTKIHGSSFVQYNNLMIAKDNFLQNPLFGTGLGSHSIAFNKYDRSYLIGNVYDSNTADANSMLLRTISEMGLFGVIFIFLFVRNNYVRKTDITPPLDYHWIISNALLVIIILQLARQGNYTFGGFMAYMWLYYYTKKDYELMQEEKEEKEFVNNESPIDFYLKN